MTHLMWRFGFRFTLTFHHLSSTPRRRLRFSWRIVLEQRYDASTAVSDGVSYRWRFAFKARLGLGDMGQCVLISLCSLSAASSEFMFPPYVIK
jgi:hypothetical protein